VRVSDAAQLDKLMDAPAYEKLLQESGGH
jgi:hypothetical protein